MSREIEETLAQRGAVYGDYEKGLETRNCLLDVLDRHKYERTGSPFNGYERVMFLDLINKLVRFAGAPDHVDSIHDLAGYATLIEFTLTKPDLPDGTCFRTK
jgi:hypothetical protein